MMKALNLLLAAGLLFSSCTESNLKNDPDLDDNKTDYPPPASDAHSTIYPSDSTIKDSVY